MLSLRQFLGNCVQFVLGFHNDVRRAEYLKQQHRKKQKTPLVSGGVFKKSVRLA